MQNSKGPHPDPILKGQRHRTNVSTYSANKTRQPFAFYELEVFRGGFSLIHIVMSLACALFGTKAGFGLEPCSITFIQSLALLLTSSLP